MGRLVPLRRQPSPLLAVNETIAALNEELQLTLNYAAAMMRDGDYVAAAEVIDEQRRSMVRATRRMEQAFAPRPQARRGRVRAALVGVAAAMALATGAFATWSPAPARPGRNTRVEAIRNASEALGRAATISDPQALGVIVGDAGETMLKIAQQARTDPSVARPLLDSVEKLRTLIQHNLNVPAKVREHARRVAEAVQQIVVAETETATSTDADTAAPSPTASPNVAP